jgi:hypothetical protein
MPVLTIDSMSSPVSMFARQMLADACSSLPKSVKNINLPSDTTFFIRLTKMTYGSLWSLCLKKNNVLLCVYDYTCTSDEAARQ